MNRKKINKIISSVVTGLYISNSLPVMALENTEVDSLENNSFADEKEDILCQDESEELDSNNKDNNGEIMEDFSEDNSEITADENDSSDDNCSSNEDDSNEEDKNVDEVLSGSEDLIIDDENKDNINLNIVNTDENIKTIVQRIETSAIILDPSIQYVDGEVTITDRGVLLDEVNMVETFDNPEDLKFQFSNSQWTVSDGKLVSNAIGNSASTKNTITLDLESAGVLTVKVRVSSQKNYDYGRIYVNGERVFFSSGNNSEFTTVTINLNEGINVIDFEYSKNASISSYEDAMFIDEMSLVFNEKNLSDNVQYRINGGAWEDYVGPFKCEKGNLIEARSMYNSNYSEIVSLNVSVANIPDQNLLRCLNEELKKDDLYGEIYVYELEKIDGIYMGDEGIEDITGLEYLINATNIALGNNNITSIEPLRGLTNLESVRLDYNENLSDISPLFGLTKLNDISLEGISPLDANSFLKLGELPLLDTLDVRVYIDDTPIVLGDGERFKSLEFLFLDSSYIKDLTIRGNSPLDDFYGYISDFGSVLIEDTDMYCIDFDTVNVNDINIRNVTGIGTLDISSVNAKNVNLENIKSTAYFSVDWSNIDNLSLTGQFTTNSKDIYTYESNINNLSIKDYNGTDHIRVAYNSSVKNINIVNTNLAKLTMSDNSFDSLRLENNSNLATIEATAPVSTKDVSLSEDKSVVITGSPLLADLSLANFGINNIYVENCDSISEVNLSGNNIKTLDNLNISNATKINISSNKIDSVVKLKDLGLLQEVNLDNNCIRDFSPLKEMASLNLSNSVFGNQNVTLDNVYSKSDEVSISIPTVVDYDGNVLPLKTVSNNGKIDQNTVTWTGYGVGTFNEILDFESVKLSSNIKITQPIIIDDVAPELNISQDESNWTNDKVILTINAIDSDSGVDYIELNDGSKVYSSEATVNIDTNGDYEFKAYDKAGNVSTKSITISNIDKTAPELNISQDESNWTNDKVTLTIKATDLDSGIDYIKLPNGKVVYDSNCEFIVDVNGEYVFEVFDKAGNISTKSISINNIDKEKPTISVVVDSYKDKAEINISASDSLSGVESITLPNGEMVESDAVKYMVVDNGEYIFVIKDVAGNEYVETVIISSIEETVIPPVTDDGDGEDDNNISSDVDEDIDNTVKPNEPIEPNKPTDEDKMEDADSVDRIPNSSALGRFAPIVAIMSLAIGVISFKKKR